MTGRKDDLDKDPWHLLPWDAVRGIVKVLAFGAIKYDRRNWERGMAWSRPYAGLMRHMTAWWERDDDDAETGLPHLWHAGCCILFLIAYELRKVGEDDRPPLPFNSQPADVGDPSKGKETPIGDAPRFVTNTPRPGETLEQRAARIGLTPEEQAQLEKYGYLLMNPPS